MMPNETHGASGPERRDVSNSKKVLEEADGGVVEYECPNCGPVCGCDVDDVGQRRCKDCSAAVTMIVTDGGTDLTGAIPRLEEAVKQLRLARESLDARSYDQDGALSKAQYLAGGVLRELEEDDDIDPSVVTDGGQDLVEVCPEFDP